MGEYRRREGGVHYDRYRNKWTIGRHHEFDYPQLADVYVYCWKHYGTDVANKVEAELRSDLTTTIAGYAKSSAVN